MFFEVIKDPAQCYFYEIWKETQYNTILAYLKLNNCSSFVCWKYLSFICCGPFVVSFPHNLFFPPLLKVFRGSTTKSETTLLPSYSRTVWTVFYRTNCSYLINLRFIWNNNFVDERHMEQIYLSEERKINFQHIFFVIPK